MWFPDRSLHPPFGLAHTLLEPLGTLKSPKQGRIPPSPSCSEARPLAPSPTCCYALPAAPGWGGFKAIPAHFTRAAKGWAHLGTVTEAAAMSRGFPLPMSAPRETGQAEGIQPHSPLLLLLLLSQLSPAPHIAYLEWAGGALKLPQPGAEGKAVAAGGAGKGRGRDVHLNMKGKEGIFTCLGDFKKSPHRLQQCHLPTPVWGREQHWWLFPQPLFAKSWIGS